MKKWIIFSIAILAHSSLAFGTQIGPATPAAGHGQVNLAAGYLYHEAEFDDVEIEQNRIYLHLGYGLGIEEEPRWEVYLRAGAADVEAEDIDGDYEPFVATGVKGAFCEGAVFAWGTVIPGGYFFDYDDEDTGVELEEFWEIEAALPVQATLGPVIVYAGPVAFYAQTDAKGSSGSSQLEEDNNVGAFGGLAVTVGNIRVEAEAQYKSDFSAGGMISWQF